MRRLIALFLLSGIPALSQESPKQESQKSADNAEKRNEDAEPFAYFRFATYTDFMAQYCTATSDDEKHEWRKKFICESKITDVVIALLTFFLAVFTFQLVRVGVRQDKTARQHLRAFVSVDTGRILNVADPIETPQEYTPSGAEIIAPKIGPLAQLSIKNTGSTPAYEVIHWCGMHFAEFPLESELPKRMPLPTMLSKGAIAPGAITTKTVRIESPLSAFQVAALRNSTAAIYVYGVIQYRDAFRRKRESNYLMTHNSGGGTIGISTDLTIGEALGKTT